MRTINEIVFSSDDEIIKNSVGEVTNSTDIWLRSKKPRFQRGGLYDKYIFGVAEKCKCGLTTAGKCPECGYVVYDKDTYAENYAYYQLKHNFIAQYKLQNLLDKFFLLGIELPELSKDPLINLWSCEFIIYKKGTDAENEITDKLMKSIFGEEKELSKNEKEAIKEEYTIVGEDGEDYILTIKEIDNVSEVENIGANGLLNLVNYSYNNKKLSFIADHINSVLPIISPALRMYSLPIINGKVRKHFPDIHFEYKAIIAMDEYCSKTMKEVKYSSIDQATILYLMNKLYNQHLAKSTMFQKSKKSTIRSNISSRLGSSGRWNAIPYEPAKLNEIYVPRSATYHALQSQIIQKLMNDFKHEEFDAFKMYESQNPLALHCFEEIVSKSQCLLVRNPTLHRNNFVQFTPKLWNTKDVPGFEDQPDVPAIGVNPYICKMYNLDFDGDQMAYFMVTEEDELLLLGDSLKAENLWIYDKTHEPCYLPTSTTMYGLYSATTIHQVPEDKRQKFDTFESMEKAYNDNTLEFDDQVILMPNTVTTYGREKISKILGTPVENFIELGPLDMKIMSKIIAGLQDHPRRIDIINEIRDFGNEIATIVGIDTLPLTDLYKNISPKIDEILKDDVMNDTLKLNKIMKLMPKALGEELRKLPDSNIEVLMKGSRVDEKTLQSLYTPYVRFNKDGSIKIGDSTIIEGLSEEEYINTAHSQRSILQVKSRAVPREGFNRSQLALLSLKLKYSKDTGKETNYIYIPEDLAKKEMRTIAESAPKSKVEGLVPVLSTATSENSIVYRDQVSGLSDKITTEGARIGIAYADAITESFYQAELKLKYGGLLNDFNGEDIYAVNEGEPKYDAENNSIFVGNYEYKISEGIIPAEKVVKNQYINKGDLIAVNANLVHVEKRFNAFYSIFDFQIAGDTKKSKFRMNKGISYAPFDGVIHYSNGNVLINNEVVDSMTKGVTYFYPEGWNVKYGDRICSKVLNLKSLLTVCPKEYAVYLYWKELSRISKFDWNTDLVDIMFKVMIYSNFSIKNKLLNEKDFGTRQVYGATGKGFKEAIKSGTDKNTMSTAIKLNDENPILKLMVRSSVELNAMNEDSPDWSFEEEMEEE